VINLKKILLLFFIFIYKDSFGNQNRIFDYLQTFSSLKSNFIQVNNNGDILTGKIFLIRPGKVRINYNEIPLLIISDGQKVATINKKLKSISFYKLSDVPIKLLLFKNFKYDNIKVLNLKESENQIVIQLAEIKKESNGYVEIIFEKQPFIMKKWIVFRDKFTKTEILLNNLKLNEKVRLELFDIDNHDPRQRVLPN
tara:strand:- start:1572 stop:2162 length:591 start_codon:yes stop_codon:yes gene_type:complete